MHNEDLTQPPPKKTKMTEIISSIFSDQNGMKLEINYKKKAGKNHKYVETEQLLYQQIKKKSKNT